MITPMALIDLLAILPFYLVFFFNINLRFLRVVRLLRMTWKAREELECLHCGESLARQAPERG